MSQGSVMEAILLFNEKAERLKELPFTRKIMEQSTGVKIDWNKEIGLKIERKGPDENEIDAFVLTLRFFVQNNEACSFGNMAKIYEGLPISFDKRKSFEKIRNSLNNLLDSDSPFVGNKNRRIFETFMYGGLAHANKQKKEYDKWVSDPFLKSFLTFLFVNIMMDILQAIFAVEDLNAEVFKELGTAQK